MKPPPPTKEKGLVELDWIRLYDSLEPATTPLYQLTQEERRKIMGSAPLTEKGRKNKLKYLKEYRQKPEAKLNIKKYEKQYMKKYRQRPEVKLRRREYAREWRKKKKEALQK